jgi:hypothetical protein
MLAAAVVEEMLLVLPVVLAAGVMAVALMREQSIQVVEAVDLMEPVVLAAQALSFFAILVLSVEREERLLPLVVIPFIHSLLQGHIQHEPLC